MAGGASAVGHHEAHHWEHSWAPALIALGATLVVPFGFTAFFVYNSPLLAAIVAGLGVPCILAGVAKWVHEGTTTIPLLADVAGKGLGVFIISEILIFLCLFASYWTVRLMAPSWPPAGTPELNHVLPLVMTVILVLSSLTYHKAENELHAGSKAGFQKWVLVSIALGVLFLCCTGYEYTSLAHEGFGPSTNVFGSAFYSLTGFHASHVLLGGCSFVAVLLSSYAARPVNPVFAKCVGIYWHFVDLVWFFVASQVYFW